MAKTIDKLIFSALFIAIVFGFFSGHFGKGAATALTAAAYALAVLLYYGVKVRRSLNKDISPEECCALLALMGAEKQTKHIYATVAEEYRVSLKPPYFVAEKEGKRYLVACLYKFLNLTQEDIAAAYRASVAMEVSRIVILTRARDRKTLALGNMIPAELFYPDKRRVYRYLRKHNALPKPLTEKKRARNKARPDWSIIASAVFDGNKLKYYLFTSLLLTVTAFLTPLKNYYLACAALPLILGAICLIRSAKERN